MTAQGALMKLNLMFVIGVILNIVFNYFLILNLKAEGAALATVVTQFFILFAEIYLVIKTFSFKVDYRSIARLALFVLILLPGSYYLMIYSPLHWISNYLLNLGLGLGLALGCKLIDLSGLKSLQWS